MSKEHKISLAEHKVSLEKCACNCLNCAKNQPDATQGTACNAAQLIAEAIAEAKAQDHDDDASDGAAIGVAPLATPSNAIATATAANAAAARLRVSIIGTCGAKLDGGKKLTATIFAHMVRHTARLILDDWKLDPANLVLVSGGSSWSDHIAVELFLRDPRFAKSQLVLHFPCRFRAIPAPATSLTHNFCDEKAWHTCGQQLNVLHHSFSSTLYGADKPWSTLHDFVLARDRGATLDDTGRGFYDRNLRVAQCDYMIAWSNVAKHGLAPKDGGTAHTWRNSYVAQSRRRSMAIPWQMQKPLAQHFSSTSNRKRPPPPPPACKK